MSVRVYEHHDDPRGCEMPSLIDALAEPPADPESFIVLVAEGRREHGCLYATAHDGECRWELTAAGRVRIAAEANGGWRKHRPGTAKALERYLTGPYVSAKELAS